MSIANNEFCAVHLQMIRCADRLDLSELTRRESSRYMLFDYFDVLTVKEEYGDTYLEYEDCIAQSKLNEPINLKLHAHIAAMNYCTLVRFLDHPYPKKLFSGGKLSNSTYSDMPFIAVIMLTFSPSFLSTFQAEGPGFVPGFLRDCIDSLDWKASHIVGPDRARSASFATLDMGHFAIVVQSKDPYAPNEIARALNKERAFAACSHDYLKEMRFQTFTTQGMELGLFWENKSGGQIIHLKQGALGDKNAPWMNKCLVILRSANTSMANYVMIKCKISQGHWLSGRYHYSQRIPLAKYLQIYPQLCLYKFGLGKLEPGILDTDLPEFYDASAVVNERLMLPCTEICIETYPLHPHHEALHGILQLKLNSLLSRQDLLPYGQNVFHEHWRLFHEVAATCASIFQFADSVYNGVTLYMMMYIAIDAIDLYLRKLNEITHAQSPASQDQSQTNKEKICSELIESCSHFLEEIMSFMKSIQTLSFQTLQSPHYGIQPGIDGEKYTMAALEFARRYSILTTRITSKSDARKEIAGRKFNFPYLCIDHHYDEMVSGTRFPPLDTEFCGRRAMPVLLKTSVPNFQYFARIYDILPLTIHEISHHTRFIERDVRNRFFIEFLFTRVASLIARYWFQTNYNGYDTDFLPDFQQLAIDAIREALLENYVDYNINTQKCESGKAASRHLWKRFDMNDLMDNLATFLRRYVFFASSSGLAPAVFTMQTSLKDELETKITRLRQYINMYHWSRYYKTIQNNVDGISQQIESEKLETALEMIREYTEIDVTLLINEELRSVFHLDPNTISEEFPSDLNGRKTIGIIQSEIRNMQLSQHYNHQSSHSLDAKKGPLNRLPVDQIDEIAIRIACEETPNNCKQFLLQLETELRQSWAEIPNCQQYAHLKEQATLEISGCLKRIYDLRLLLDTIRALTARNADALHKKPCKDDFHDVFCNCAAEKLSQKMRDYFQEQTGTFQACLLADSTQISQSQVFSSDLLPLSIALVQSCQAINSIEKEQLLESARYCYEEVCADLCMSAILDLTPLGCLCLYAKHENRIHDSSNVNAADNSSYERFNYVLAILLLNEYGENVPVSLTDDLGYYYAPIQDLVQALMDQITSTASITISFLTKDFPDDCSDYVKSIETTVEKHSDTLMTSLHHLLKAMNKNIFHSIPDEIHIFIQDLVSGLKETALNRPQADTPLPVSQLLEALESIHAACKDGKEAPLLRNNYTVSNIFNQWRYLFICINYLITSSVPSPYQPDIHSVVLSIRINRDHYHYFLDMYTVIKEKHDRDFLLNGIIKNEKHPPESKQTADLCREIGAYYNNYEIVIDPKRKREMLNWTFEYILAYYYSHIFSLPKLFNGEASEIKEEQLRDKILEYLGDRNLKYPEDNEV